MMRSLCKRLREYFVSLFSLGEKSKGSFEILAKESATPSPINCIYEELLYRIRVCEQNTRSLFDGFHALHQEVLLFGSLERLVVSEIHFLSTLSRTVCVGTCAFMNSRKVKAKGEKSTSSPLVFRDSISDFMYRSHWFRLIYIDLCR